MKSSTGAILAIRVSTEYKLSAIGLSHLQEGIELYWSQDELQL
jgi:hypothetical protein